MIKGSFPMSKVLVFEGKTLDYFMILDYFMMVKNVIKGSFPISKVLVFEGNSYVCWKMKILDYFMIANGKECD